MDASTMILLLGFTVIFIGIMVVGIMWAVRSNQFDDMEGPAQRILMDDDDK